MKLYDRNDCRRDDDQCPATLDGPDPDRPEFWTFVDDVTVDDVTVDDVTVSEYQLESEPESMPVQCSGRGHECWCVDAEGQEVAGTRTNSSAPHCASPCRLQSVLRCSLSGLFESVQCDSSRGQCWCVDQDGMELYGTRQSGSPLRCPGSCEVRSRRLLHASASHSPPQCAEDGSFLPVQCRFINMTDRTEVDLLHAFNRFPESFETFSSFRKLFPTVSSFCFCSDSRGRELDNTGVELLLSQVYDSAFSSLQSTRSVSQTNIYRVLQRRMLGVRLAVTGHFRCPSPCEEERRPAMEASSVFIPSCETRGSFTSRQCQQGGQCWCVDPTGRELPGTRQHGDSLVCGSGPVDCLSQRRLALSRLFSGPVDPPNRASSGTSPSSSLSLVRPLKDLLPVEADPISFLSHLVEVLHGLFPSVGGALQALARSSPRRLQENLFGGKFLKNAASFNFSARWDSEEPSAWTASPLRPPASRRTGSWSSSGSGQRGRPGSRLHPELHAQRRFPGGSVRRCRVLVRGSSGSGGRGVACGRPAASMSVPLREERATALKVRGNMAAGAEIHIPACSEDGDFLPLQCVGSRCFCVDGEGKRMLSGSAGGAITCVDRSTAKRPPSAGRCSEALAEVTAFRQEVKRIVTLSNSSHLPLGYGFLLAEGLRLTPEELQTSQSEEELQISDRLLSRSNAALRLAAFSTVQMFLPRQHRSYQLFTPQCDADGGWLHTQCYHSTGQCWCVDEDGQYIADSLTSRSLHLPRCLSLCQRSRAHTLLSGWMKGSDISTTSSPDNPQCEEVPARVSCGVSSAAPTAPSSRCSVMSLPVGVSQRTDRKWAGPGRLDRQDGRRHVTVGPLCPAPTVSHGALVCHPAAGGRQSCDLVCHRGYQNSLPVSSFLCDPESLRWDGAQPLGGACQMSRPLQSVSSSQLWASSSSSCSQISRLQTLLFNMMTSRGLCSAQLPASAHSVSLCDDSSVRLRCDDGGDSLKLTIRWTAHLSDLPTSDLPDLHDVGVFLNRSGLLDGVQGLLGNIRSELTSEPKLVSMETAVFGCSRGYRLSAVTGKAASFVHLGASPRRGRVLCPEGTYQDEEGRDFCDRCPRGSSPAGASSVNQCVTECQRRGLRCSERGDFLSAQPDLLSGRWRCVDSEGVELDWTDSDRPLTDDECSVLSRFQAVPGSDLIVGAEDAEVLQTMTSDLTTCVHGNRRQQTFKLESPRLESTKGFLGNPQAELFDWLSCSLRVRGGASGQLVIRKKGAESPSGLRMMKALSGSLLCGWLRAPSVLMCGDQDWDMIGQGAANRICGAGLTYNEQQKNFLFDFGGQTFAITDSALPPDSKNKKDYQASIVSFQRVYLNTDAESAAGGSTSSSCPAAEPAPPEDVSVRLKFKPLSEGDVVVDTNRKLPSLSFWLNKNNYDSQQALLWCLSRCDAEPLCSVADLRDADSAGFFSCSLLPDSRVCGAYDKPLRRACRPLLDTRPNNTYSKKVDLSGPVKSFYERVSFQKMVSYSVRNRVSVAGNTLLSEGFMECERRCDEDPCCRGIGFVRDTASTGGSGVVCLSLISLGVQTCGEDTTTWRTQDCRPSAVKTTPDPFGWYQKPVSRSLDGASLISFLVDPSVSTYDVIHVSRDIATDRGETRDWCLHACQEAESCVAVTISEVESATRCVLYPDTTACGLSSAPSSSSHTSSCRLVIREPAPQVYLRTARLPLVTAVSIPGHGTLHGVGVETALGSDRKTVVQFLGVPYARPPIGSLRFEAAQPADWTGTWDATKPRPSCVQPGDVDSSASNEDCLYLNVFTPAAQRGRVPVLVYFFNPSANQNPGLLDGSALAAVGNIVVVTASYRTAALGFLSTGVSGSSGLHGNYGLSDQEAVLRWVHAHISLVGGDSGRVTVGAERGGADITSLHLLSSSSSSRLLFQRMMLMGGSVFSPSLVQTPPTSRRQAIALAKELGCVTSDLDDGKLAACLRAAPVGALNAAQTKLLAVTGPFQSWSPLRPSVSQPSLRRVDLLLGTSEHDGLLGRARRIKDFEALQGRADGKTAFYEALSRSLGGATGSDVLKEAAAWFYSLDHSPSAAGYNLFSRALNNATRDLFIICPALQMASHWANSKANIFLYHQPAASAHDRAEPSVPLDLQFVFGTPYHPMSSQRFTSSDRRLSLAMMTYVSSFARTGNPNPSRVWAESILPRWQQVLSSEAPPTYLELSPALQNRQGLSQSACSFWSQLGPKLTGQTGDLGAEPALTAELPVASPSNQSQTEKDAYS
ncbi:Thyroglobulin [Larimichthys crocea]|uniref:Thyroglobulin n=1 Tax=Larimichthys crocea TaxID=215358 RepID=A0A6G0ICZ5_LARCR|nr:Thyroglobulin [Larimichthys crocea]